jgi:hypothetical protein
MPLLREAAVLLSLERAARLRLCADRDDFERDEPLVFLFAPEFEDRRVLCRLRGAVLPSAMPWDYPMRIRITGFAGH